MIFDGVDFMCEVDKSLNGPVGQEIYYSVFSSNLFDNMSKDEFMKKKLFFYFIKFRDLAHRYSFPEGEIYSKNFYTYTTLPNEKNLIKIIGASNGSFDNYFQIDDFNFDPKNYITTENGLIRYDFHKFQLHCCSVSKKNLLIPRKFEEHYNYCCDDCNGKIVIYGYDLTHGLTTIIKKVPYCVAPWPSQEDIINFEKSSKTEEKQLYLNLTEIGFKHIYDQYVDLYKAKYCNRMHSENYRVNDEFYNDDRDLDDQSQEFWDSL
jgi:hypothetical protein